MSAPRLHPFSYLTGLFTAVAIALIVLWFVEQRVGVRHLREDLFPRSEAIDLPPPDIQTELKTLGAVPDNMLDFTQTEEHQTFLTRPDAELEFVLRPHVVASAYILRSRRDFNIDPPVLYVPGEPALSSRVSAYLDATAVVRYRFSTNADGARTTLPAVISERRILVIGDSVAFGVGVNDDSTIASHLQRRLGPAFQVVNAGVGNYDDEQIVRAAARHTTSRSFAALIYVANMNDFAEDSEPRMLDRAAAALTRLAALKPRVSDRIVVALHTDLEYALRNIIDAGVHGWTGSWIAHASAMRARLPVVAKELGLVFVDSSQLIDDRVRATGTVFSPFAYYADHAHLSSDGSRLVADELWRSLATLGLTSP